MNIVFTILIGFAVLIATLLFLSCSLCAVSGGLSGQGRAISVVLALVSLGVMTGGVYLIARINRREEPLE
jgi:multisubunit Na+/H+ antiporter MnhC subunit